MRNIPNFRLSALSAASIFILAACAAAPVMNDDGTTPSADATTIHPEKWPEVMTAALDPAVEARVDDLLSKMTLRQKVGQVIQGDTNALTPEDVKNYRLGSVLSGGNSAPGPLPYADTQTWLEAADAYFNASIDPDGVDTAIPIIWGIDAVHGHANLRGAVVFPHNIDPGDVFPGDF